MYEILISVIVPVYNVEKYLRRCVDSILGQTYRKLEIILIDDGSCDESAVICDGYAQTDDRVIVIHKENAGQAEARKSGMCIATGEYITFVDADDYIDLDMYENIIKNCWETMPDIVAFDLIEEYSDHKVVKRNFFEEGIYGKEQLKEYIYPKMLSGNNFFNFGILPNLVCKLLKKTFLESNRISVSSKVRFGEDADAVFQYMSYAKTLQIIWYAPYHYCKRECSMASASVASETIELLREDLENSFKQAGIWEIMENQLDEYITFVKLLKNPRDVSRLDFIFDGSRVALFGCGAFGQALAGSYGNSITVIADKNYEKYKEYNRTVVSVEELIDRQQEYDKVFIAILDVGVCMAVKDNLVEMGLQREVAFYKPERMSVMI